MAYNDPKNLDEFLPHLGNKNVTFRQALGRDLKNYLASHANTIQYKNLADLIDGVTPWLKSSNYKVSRTGIEIITSLVNRLGIQFRPYVQALLPVVIDRLGDAKQCVRETTQLLLRTLLDQSIFTPQHLVENLEGSFSHKNSKIREELLRCFVNTLNRYGSQSIALRNYIPTISIMVSDKSASVRDMAFSTIIECYKHIGDPLRIDLERLKLPAVKLAVLMFQFDEIKDAGELLPTAIDNSAKPGCKCKLPCRNNLCKCRKMMMKCHKGCQCNDCDNRE